jgi:hypothetical protein
MNIFSFEKPVEQRPMWTEANVTRADSQAKLSPDAAYARVS